MSLADALSLQLGPQGFDKIAIIGSAPSSTLLAPFDDPSWSIWCTSPSVFATVASRRSNVWFELHRFLPYLPGQNNKAGTRPWFSPEFKSFLQQYLGPVFMTEKQPDIPNCVQFPYQELLDKHGPYHFCSSISWMLALALECNIKQLGLFGVDMAAGSEWAYQRPSCQHFLGLAKQLGIEVVLPPESDLMRPTTLYGIGEHSHRHVKLRERQAELMERKANILANMNQMTVDLNQIEGGLQMLNYILECWTDDVQYDVAQAMSFSGVFNKTVPAVSTGADVIRLESAHA